ncbi:hypothetical protein PENTCL1PPCAC_6609, partial [Pristionchus entomophagus]
SVLGMAEINRRKGLAKIDIQSKNAPIGVELDGKGKVKKIQPSSSFLGILFTNDIIISVNDKPVQTTAEFFNSVKKNVPGKIHVSYEKDHQYTTSCKKLEPVHPNTELYEVELAWRSGGTRIGMLIHRDFEGHVVVAVVEDGGAASSYVKPGDHLLKVNKVEVTDREKARALIMKSINDEKKVSITIERPVAQKSLMIAPSVIVDPVKNEDKSLTQDLPKSTAGKVDDPSKTPAKPENKSSASTPPQKSEAFVITESPRILTADTMKLLGSSAPTGFKPIAPYAFAPDIMDILKENLNFYKDKPTTGGCLVNIGSTPSSPVSSKASVTLDKPPELAIMCDPSPKDLKITPKRAGAT